MDSTADRIEQVANTLFTLFGILLALALGMMVIRIRLHQGDLIPCGSKLRTGLTASPISS